jgi:dihydrofolate synthase / folylpolyglutamate synthase
MKKITAYGKCIEYLIGLERAGIKYDLKNIRTLLKFLGNPEKKFKSVHIAGTNGKGSVASVINSVLIESGYKTGLYTSPHINDFRERILINGNLITEKFVIDFTNRLYDLIEEIKPSFFEATTAMAFDYFAEQKADYAVIEAGLGGRLDSTNVLKPVISVITGISIDHTEYLGDTIEKIAYEKAGIVKSKIPCVTGGMEAAAKKVITDKCRTMKSSILDAEKTAKVKIVKREEDFMEIEFGYDREKIRIKYPVTGSYQIHNIKTALTALGEIGRREKILFSGSELKSGFENVKKNSKFYGRFQRIGANPKIVIDVSHNVQGIRNIKENLKYFKYRKLYVIFGMMKDKEYEKCLRKLEKLDAKIILTKPDYKRAEEPEVLFKSVNKKEKFYIAGNVKAAHNYVKKALNKSDLLLITGSFFLVSDFLKLKSFSPLT